MAGGGGGSRCLGGAVVAGFPARVADLSGPRDRSRAMAWALTEQNLFGWLSFWSGQYPTHSL